MVDLAESALMYLELHRHSDFSTLDGAGKPAQFAERAAALDMWALGQTDHGNLNGALEHMKACEALGIQPIVGMEAYYRPNRHVQGQAEWQYRRWHVILIAKDLVGWHNLLRISSEAFRSGFYQDPCVDDELLRKYNEGLICTTSCILGPLAYLIENATDAAADAWLDQMATIFNGRLFIAIHPHDFDRQRAMNPELIYRAQSKGIPLTAEGDAHYVYDGWADTQKIIALISTNTTMVEAVEKNRERIARGDEAYELGHEGLHLMSGAEMLDRFARFHPSLPRNIVEEAVAMPENIARMCVPFMIDRTLKMPRATSTIEEAERIVWQWCREGMQRIGKVGDPQYEKQLEYEFKLMREKKVLDYIYMTGDVVRWARSSDSLPPSEEDPAPQQKRPIRVGSSRGSAGASLLCYCCRITGINPINHKLKFERFLNPGRKGLPDIDIDFPDDRRDLVKEYVARKYGRDCVADIMAMARFTPRAAISNVARIMGIDYQETKNVTDQIDPVHDENLAEMRMGIPSMDVWADKYPDAWTHAVRLENAGDPMCMRLGKHAAGVVITPGPINDYMPTIKASEEDTTSRTAWSETPRLSIVDDFGFSKWDFLSVRGMTQQDRIVAQVADRTGEQIDLDQLPVCFDPYDVDPKVMDVFQQGYTLGIWQFEGMPITAFLKRARPDNVVDLAAINALYRPGPMGAGGHNRYAKRRRGEEQYEIPEPLRDTLSDTMGVHCFQEQIMEIFQVLVGYTAAQADDVRKEIDKLNRGKSDQGRIRLAARANEFITKASELIGREGAENLWAEILPYTGYSFNRPHSSGYSVQAYQDAWLKTYYPFDFYAVVLTLEDEKTPRAIKEARNFGVSIERPDVNRSGAGYTVDFDSEVIRFGLIGIHGLGPTAAEQVMQKAPYESLEHFDLSHSFKYSKCNKGHKQALLEAGALDSLGARADWTEAQKAATELERLKMALRPGGTFGDSESYISSSVNSEDEFDALQKGDPVVVAGKITDVRKTVTKRGRNPGQAMSFIRIQFALDSFSCTLFPAAHAAADQLLEVGRGVIIRGEKDDRDQVIVKATMDVNDWLNEMQVLRR